MRTALLATVVLLAAALRFAGIGHHLRYGGPEFDERNLIEPALRMWRTRTADPTVFTGYAGFFTYLVFLPVGLGQRLGGETASYLAARGLIAAFGTLSVLLAYLLGRRLHGGEAAALLGAALLAVSRVEVRSAHYVTPDVVVGAVTLAMFLALASWPGRRGELAAAAAAALGTAVKYSALMLAPALVVHLALERRLLRGLLPAALVAVAVFALAAPYAVLGLGGTGMGLAGGVEDYFGRPDEPVTGSGLPELIGTLWLSVGPLGLALAALSLALPERRRLVPAWTVVATMVAVAAAANLIYARHVTSAAVILPVLAGAGFEWLRRSPAAGRTVLAAVAVGALAPPVYSSAGLLARYLKPSVVEQAARWIERDLAGPALVVSALRLQLAPARFEVRIVDDLSAVPAEALLQYDGIISGSLLPGLDPAVRFASEKERPEGEAYVFFPGRTAWRRAPTPELRASAPGVEAAGDDRPETAWSAPEGPSWIEARWPAPVTAARVEIEVGPGDRQWPQPLQLLASGQGGWEPLAAEGLRPTRPARQRQGAPHGQVFALVPPRELMALRLERPTGGPWQVTELRVLTR